MGQIWNQIKAVEHLKRISQNPDTANVAKLYDHAIAIEEAQDKIDKPMSDQTLTQKQKQEILGSFKSHDQITAQYKTPAIEDKITSIYDEAISKITSQSPVEILNLDIQTLQLHSRDAWARYKNSLEYGDFSHAKGYLDDYLSTTGSILWKRGAVTVKSVSAMVKSIFTSSKANVSAKAQKQVIDNATANIPDKNASTEVKASWIQKYITQPISDLITRARGKTSTSTTIALTPEELQARVNQMIAKKP